MNTLYRRLLAAGPMRPSDRAPFLFVAFCDVFHIRSELRGKRKEKRKEGWTIERHFINIPLRPLTSTGHISSYP
jgi:hypothetical protein